MRTSAAGNGVAAGQLIKAGSTDAAAPAPAEVEFTEYVGKPLEDAERMASEQGFTRTRVVAQDDNGNDVFEPSERKNVTRDFFRDRLNFELTQDGKVMHPPYRG